MHSQHLFHSSRTAHASPFREILDTEQQTERNACCQSKLVGVCKGTGQRNQFLLPVQFQVYVLVPRPDLKGAGGGEVRVEEEEEGRGVRETKGRACKSKGLHQSLLCW
ncbi:hypothetical protein FKM82_027515 [Ascaphus truei]